jgi:hypothetical protein
MFPDYADALLMVPLKEAVNAVPTIFTAETLSRLWKWRISASYRRLVSADSRPGRAFIEYRRN